MVKYPAPSAPSTVVVPTTSRVHDGVLEAACVALANVGTNADHERGDQCDSQSLHCHLLVSNSAIRGAAVDERIRRLRLGVEDQYLAGVDRDPDSSVVPS